MSDPFIQDLRRLVSMSQRGRSMSRGSGSSRRSRSRPGSSLGRRSSHTLVEGGGFGRRPGDSRMVQSPYFNPFPSMMRNKMRYVENVILTTVVSSDDAVVHYFSCNGIHDPNVTGTGHQPYGHDIVASLYNHYRVDKSVITVTPSTGLSQMIWGVAITDDISTSSTDAVMQERKQSKYAISPSTDTIVPQVLTMGWKPDQAFPVGGGEQKNMNSAYGSNPGEQMYFAVYLRRPIVGLAVANVSFNVQIDYYVTSFELKQLVES